MGSTHPFHGALPRELYLALAHFEEVAVSTGHGGPGQPTYLKTWKLTFTMMDDDNDGKLNRDEFHWHDSPWKKDEL